MDKDQLLRSIAETGYNVGFGARKTFATFDIVEKAPGWIGIGSFAAGIFALFVERLADKVPSAILLIVGVAALYVGFYRSSEYEATAKKLLGLHNQLRHLYRSVQSGADVPSSQQKLSDMENEYYAVTVSKQVFLSDWYAHYKFFAQSQIDWMDEQLHFRWWKDKIPLSAKVVIVGSVVALVVWLLRVGLRTMVC
ncbi:SLATT domain-containing protein [Sphingobium sp. Z007]|uniref:SLATT domain-containing protein n=1 Tax=Sphingobium sp. Z007 TaxID=627495 RepID=UPI000B49AEB8|nr:SLATT domain-containing protein [Sphingobium sp. Z007]